MKGESDKKKVTRVQWPRCRKIQLKYQRTKFESQGVVHQRQKLLYLFLSFSFFFTQVCSNTLTLLHTGFAIDIVY